MIYLSELLIQNPGLESFDDLVQVIGDQAKKGEIHLKVDIKPNYPVTPTNWEDRVEGAFAGVYSVIGATNSCTEED